MSARPVAERVLLVAFLIVAVVAGIAGVVTVVIPQGTGDYFAWALAPNPLASIVGGLSRPVLVALRREGGAAGPPQGGPLRAGLAVLALAYLAGAIALRADPTAFPAPFDMPPMGGRFLGAWCLLMAVMDAWPALRGRREARSPSSPWSPPPPAPCCRPSELQRHYAVARPGREPRPRSPPPRTSSRRADRRDAGTATWPLPGWPLGWS